MNSFWSRIALPLVVSLAAAGLAGFVGSVFTSPGLSWYATVAKPAFNPPDWVFGPVWTALYMLMAVAAFLVWRRRERRGARGALWLYVIQLLLNALWSFLFFGLHNPLLALAELAFLWLAIAATVLSFSRVSRAAAWLLAPYIVWVSFAAVLNFAIWMLN